MLHDCICDQQRKLSLLDQTGQQQRVFAADCADSAFAAMRVFAIGNFFGNGLSDSTFAEVAVRIEAFLRRSAPSCRPLRLG